RSLHRPHARRRDHRAWIAVLLGQLSRWHDHGQAGTGLSEALRLLSGVAAFPRLTEQAGISLHDPAARPDIPVPHGVHLRPREVRARFKTQTCRARLSASPGDAERVAL